MAKRGVNHASFLNLMLMRATRLKNTPRGDLRSTVCQCQEPDQQTEPENVVCFLVNLHPATWETNVAAIFVTDSKQTRGGERFSAKATTDESLASGIFWSWCLRWRRFEPNTSGRDFEASYSQQWPFLAPWISVLWGLTSSSNQSNLISISSHLNIF